VGLRFHSEKGHQNGVTFCLKYTIITQKPCEIRPQLHVEICLPGWIVTEIDALDDVE